MINLFLKTNNKEEMINALPFARARSEGGIESWVTNTHEYSLVVIGTLYNNDAVYNDDGEVIAPPTVKKGFHVNIRCNNTIAQVVPKFIVIDKPQNPSNVFF